MKIIIIMVVVMIVIVTTAAATTTIHKTEVGLQKQMQTELSVTISTWNLGLTGVQR
jgi:hypothetical protein